jgi:hypothetical protein
MVPRHFVFFGFNDRLVAKIPQNIIPYDVPTRYDQYVSYLSLWFGEVLGISTQEFKSQYGSQSGRSGGTSAASNADIDLELWGQHGDWATFQSQKRYMKKDIKALLSVSLAAMNVPSSSPLVVDVDISLDPREDLDNSQSTHFGNSTPSMDRIPAKAFCWHG